MRLLRQSCTVLALALFGALTGSVGAAVLPIPLVGVGEFQDKRGGQEVAPELPAASLLFVGDVMLGRHVERLTRVGGHDYPFLGITALFSRAESVVVNFEAAVPAVHQPTPDFTFRFSVPTHLVESLKRAGATHVSLANNHTYDFGTAGFTNTQRVLAAAGIESFGHPQLLDEHMVSYTSLGQYRVALIGLHTLARTPTEGELESLIRAVQAKSDLQFVYIHWGTEYKFQPNASERRLVQVFAELGVTAVVGHHPHVVQSIEVVDGMPVFYSLGNFIFDQYFSQAVQTGLALHVTAEGAVLTYELIPVTSLGTRSQPQVSDGQARTDALQQLATISDPELAAGIVNGSIVQTLATSAQNSMMAE